MTTPETLDARRAHLAKIGLKEGECCVFKQFEPTAEPLDGRRVRFTVTTSTPDRERDVVVTSGIDLTAFRRNPIITWAHDYKALPVGRAVEIDIREHSIQMVVEFATADLNPMAEQVYRMIKAGFIKATSIGFRPLEWEYVESRGGVDFLRSELLETAIVPIPANSEALIAAASAGIDVSVIKDWAVRTLEPFGMTKSILDLMDLPEVERAAEMARLRAEAPRVDAFRYADVTRQGDAHRVYANRDGCARWNPQLSKAFDVTTQEFPARSIEQDVAAKHCGCQVRDLYHRHEPVYSTRMGAFLAALDETVAQMQVDDVRNLGQDGREEPPLYERIQLNSTRAEEFLVDGLRFVKWNGVALAIRVEPRWFGLQVTTYAARAHADAAREVFERTFARARELNFLKGEAFSLSGEFLQRGAESFDDIFLDQKNMQLGQRLLQLVNEKGAQLENRGVIYLGAPGNGKTLLGRILMNQANATFIWASARDFWYSGGFRGLASAFEIGRESAEAGTPAILFIEDVDNYLDGHTTDLMKTEMDGIAQSRGIVTILTTNYPELLPKALIDRPGRFHDVVRFDLPDATARQRMLAKWLPDLVGAALAETVQALHGYSGAHVREFARFAGIIREQDGVDVAVAAKSALAKLQEQRDLITSVQANGSRYRAPEHALQRVEAGPAPTLVEIARGQVLAAPFDRLDPVAWKAYVKARERVARRSAGEIADDVVANLLEDYGFDDEAATIRRVAEQPDALAVVSTGLASKLQAVVEAKRGRVLSKTNEERIRNAQACAESCSQQLDDVLASINRPDEDEVPDGGHDGDDVEMGIMVLDEQPDEVVVILSDEDDPSAPAADGGDEIVVVSDEEIGEAIGSAISAALQVEVGRQLSAALNAARGRID